MDDGYKVVYASRRGDVVKLRCRSRARTEIGGMVRCDLPRKHKGLHACWLGIDPITWR